MCQILGAKVTWCCFNCHLVRKTFWQTEHCSGYSALWIFKCSLKVRNSLKLLSHFGHWNTLSALACTWNGLVYFVAAGKKCMCRGGPGVFCSFGKMHSSSIKKVKQTNTPQKWDRKKAGKQEKRESFETTEKVLFEELFLSERIFFASFVNNKNRRRTRSFFFAFIECDHFFLSPKKRAKANRSRFNKSINEVEFDTCARPAAFGQFGQATFRRYK